MVGGIPPGVGHRAVRDPGADSQANSRANGTGGHHWAQHVNLHA